MQELRPDNSTILNNRAFNLYRQGRYAEAIPFYEKAISIDPQFAYPWDNLGFIKYKLGFTEEAFQLIDKALELDRGNSYAYMYKGKIHMEQGNKIQAMENFQLALRYGFTETYGDEVVQLIKQCQ
jgi:tetratricopeptide (TPR) repeat protein